MLYIRAYNFNIVINTNWQKEIISNLVTVQDHVGKCYPSDPISWNEVMSKLQELVTSDDMKRLKKYCDRGDRRFQWLDYSVYKKWKRSFTGEPEYCKIFTGLSGEEKPESIEYGYDSDNFDPEMFDEEGIENSGKEYFLAYHQWNAFEKWLTQHPECAAQVKDFKVSQRLLYYATFAARTN
jgi:hypothetical protein